MSIRQFPFAGSQVGYLLYFGCLYVLHYIKCLIGLKQGTYSKPVWYKFKHG